MSTKKPTGQIGPFKVESGTSGATGKWDTIAFPTDKRAIESIIVRQFVDGMKRAGASVLSVQPNEEADFDFTLSLPGGRVYLELREVHYRDGPGRPYDSRQIRIESFKYAEQIVEAVHDKSGRYPPESKIPIDLLLYVTHWRFEPNEVVIRLAQHLLQTRRPIFENVFLVLPTDQNEAEVRLLYPSDNPLEGRSLDDLRDHWYLNLDPAKWKVLSEHPSGAGDPPTSPSSA